MKKLFKVTIALAFILTCLFAGSQFFTASETERLVPVTRIEIPDIISGKPVYFPPLPYQIVDCSQGRALIFDFKTAKYGYVNQAGKLITPLQFRSGSSFSEGLAAVVVGTDFYTMGFIDINGQWVVKPRFLATANEFSEGLAAVQEIPANLVDKDGNLSSYDSNLSYWAPWGFIDKTGNFVIKPGFHRVSNFSEGLAPVQVGYNNSWGFINKKGEFVIRAQYDWASSFHESLAAVKVQDKCGYIDKNGDSVIIPRYDDANNFSEGLAAVRIGDDQTGKWGYINKAGEMLIEPRFSFAEDFRNGFARVSLDGKTKTRMIDRSGDFSGTEIYSLFTMSPSGDMKKVGFADSKSGQLVIKPQFNAVRSFSDGLAAVRSYNYPWLWGYCDHTGRLVIKPQFDTAGDFHHGHADVVLKGGLGSVDKNGRFKLKSRLPSVIFKESPVYKDRARLILRVLRENMDNRRSNDFLAVDFSDISLYREEKRQILEGLRNMAPDVYDYALVKNDKDKFIFGENGETIAVQYGLILDVQIEEYSENEAFLSGSAFSSISADCLSSYKATNVQGEWQLKLLSQGGP